MNIEVEIRSFISVEQYQHLKQFFTTEGTLLEQDEQETHYLQTSEDVRIQQNQSSAKIVIKAGKVHDESREETEIICPPAEFRKMETLFSTLNIPTKIKWFRQRHKFIWEGITVCLDFTRGYGYILELEKMATAEEKEKIITLLKEKLARLGIPLTPREEFEQQFKHYEQNWRELTTEKN